jgi:tetratricopeptide (TPR) repeat protein
MAGQRLESAQFIERALSAYSRGLRWLEAAPENPSTWNARTQGEAMLRFRIGKLLILGGDRKRGERALQLALDISSDASLPWIEVRAHVALGRSYMERGKPVLAKAHLLQAHAMLKFEDDDALSVACLEARAELAFQEGRNDDALTLWSEALAVAGSDRSARARCLLGLANQHLRAGRGDDAAPLLELALAAATDASDRILLGRAQNNRGLVALIGKRFDEALVWFRKALQTREGIGYPRGIIINHHNIGDAHFGNKDLAKAWVAFERSYELATDIGWEGGQALNDVYLGYIHGQQAYEQGVARLHGARAVAKRLQDAETSATGAWLAGRLHAEQQNVQEATEAWTEGLAQAKTYGLTSLAQTRQDGLDSLPGNAD